MAGCIHISAWLYKMNRIIVASSFSRPHFHGTYLMALICSQHRDLLNLNVSVRVALGNCHQIVYSSSCTPIFIEITGDSLNPG